MTEEDAAKSMSEAIHSGHPGEETGHLSPWFAMLCCAHVIIRPLRQPSLACPMHTCCPLSHSPHSPCHVLARAEGVAPSTSSQPAAPAPAPAAPAPALAAPAPAASGVEAALQQLMGLGFTREQAMQALQAAGGNVEAAAAYLTFGGDM